MQVLYNLYLKYLPLVHVRVFFQEEDYEWGSHTILDALPSINSQQKRLALAAMRWRKTLQGRTNKEVQTLLPLSCLSYTHFKSHRFPSYSSIPSLGCIWGLDSDVEYRPGQRCRIQKIAAVWRSKGLFLIQFKISLSWLYWIAFMTYKLILMM